MNSVGVFVDVGIIFGIGIWFGIVCEIVLGIILGYEVNFGIVTGSEYSGSLTSDRIRLSFPTRKFVG